MATFQENLISPPILVLSYAEGNFTLDTDACNVQVGWVLLQYQPDTTKQLIGY